VQILSAHLQSLTQLGGLAFRRFERLYARLVVIACGGIFGGVLSRGKSEIVVRDTYLAASHSGLCNRVNSGGPVSIPRFAYEIAFFRLITAKHNKKRPRRLPRPPGYPLTLPK
jgi:hypothetical protein